jgi:hypothetical protein
MAKREKGEKTRQMVMLSASVAVGLSATSIVSVQSASTPSEHLKVIQSALRDGATVKVDTNVPPRVRLANKDWNK